MKRILVLVLAQLMLLTPLASAAADAQTSDQDPQTPVSVSQTQTPAELFQAGVEAGRDSASHHYHSYPWLIGGFAGTAFMPLIGTGVVAGFSQLGEPQPPADHLISLRGQPEQYQLGFVNGYGSRAKAKALGRTLLGGAIATALVIGILTAAMSQPNYSLVSM